MANIAVQRIKREFKEVLKSEETSKNQIKVDLVDENFTELRGEIAGPPDTPYEGGRYQLEIKIPETYPFNPPKYKQNPEMFKQTARLWSHVYAGAPVSSPEYTRKIDKLCAMGFEKNAVIVALSSKSWDVETATELLLSN
ncbi:ubiquitin-conjugating enzyme E2Ka isoform X4 [Echeneis naucrates]|uniref:ubiquitin-conjugating enzyme E2Ka isoform X4 n=1 Tax=Echeneis naucrates TaxID=173247 RepID=UPI001113E48A|nr:ubiquitin-conjugating enzyme E2 K isoform X4 [Echeneis naucrates]